jgi:hypothetical protein
MMENEEFLFPWADKTKYFEYQRRITANVEEMNPTLTKAMKLDGTIVGKKETQCEFARKYMEWNISGRN